MVVGSFQDLFEKKTGWKYCLVAAIALYIHFPRKKVAFKTLKMLLLAVFFKTLFVK